MNFPENKKSSLIPFTKKKYPEKILIHFTTQNRAAAQVYVLEQRMNESGQNNGIIYCF